MKIIIINHYAGGPEYGMEFRPYYLAREWRKDGNYVNIISASFSHTRFEQPKVIHNFHKQIIDGINYFWIKTPKYKGNGIKRFINILVFVAKLALNFKKIPINFQPNVVISSSTYPLDIFPAYLIAKKSKAKLIFEVHDLWPLSPMVLGGMYKYHPFIILMQQAENFAYKNADIIISMLPLAKDYMIKHGMKNDKFFYIPNGICIEEWENANQELPEIHKNEINMLRNTNKFLICYAGAHGLANGLYDFIRCAKILEDKNVQIVLVGDGPEKEGLINFTKKINVKNVSFLPGVSKNTVPSLLKEMDILFFSLKNCEIFKYGISPNKIFDYMMAGKPIISAVNAGNDLITEASCGLSVEPGNPQGYANAIITLLNMDEKERTKLGANGKSYVKANHDYKILAKNFLEILK